MSISNTSFSRNADGVVADAGLPQAVLSINTAINTIINMDFGL